MYPVWTCRCYFHLNCEETSSESPHAQGHTAPGLELGGTPHWSRQNAVTSSGRWEAIGRTALCAKPCSARGGSCLRSRPAPPPPPGSRSPPELPLGLTCAHPGSQGASFFTFPAMMPAPWIWKGTWTPQNRGSINTPGQTSQSLAKAQLGCFRLNWPLL